LLVRVGGEFVEGLEVADAEQVVGGVSAGALELKADLLDGGRLGGGDGLAGLRYPLGLEDAGALLALGAGDLSVTDALRLEDGGSLVALSAHLLLHRLAHVRRWANVLQFDA